MTRSDLRKTVALAIAFSSSGETLAQPQPARRLPNLAHTVIVKSPLLK